MINDLIIGSNSYLGINLIKVLDPANTLLISKSANDELGQNFRYIQYNYCEQAPLNQIGVVKRVFLFARPFSTNYIDLVRFYSNIRHQVVALIESNKNIEIHFTSTALVYESETPELKETSARLDLKGSYEYFKWEFEQFLLHLSQAHPEISVNIHRIPLLIGGIVRSKDRSKQLFYHWLELFKAGEAWVFEEEDTKRNFGTSWLNISDFSENLQKGNSDPGFKIFHPVSGHINYHSFYNECRKKLCYRPIAMINKFPKSYLYLKSNTKIQARDFWDCFIPSHP
jgi:hypothetical protein